MSIVFLFVVAFIVGVLTAYTIRRVESYYFRKQLQELYERQEEFERRKSEIYSRIYNGNGNKEEE